MNYTDTTTLEAFLVTGVGHWPLRETCTPAEASAKVAIQTAAGRRCVEVRDGNGVQTGWDTFTPAPVG